MENFNLLMEKLTENARFALQKADFYAKKYGNGYMGTEHLLLGIAAQDASTGARFLLEESANLPDLEKSLGRPAQEVEQAQMAMMSISESAIMTLKMSDNLSSDIGLEFIGTEHILHSLITQPNSKAVLALKKLHIDPRSLTAKLEKYFDEQAEEEKVEAEKRSYGKKPMKKWLTRYGTELTSKAKDGKLDAVIGRDQEIERMVTILSRRQKSNPVLIGEPGVGKTAIVEGLAQKIADHNVPSSLVGKKIYQIDLPSLVAGTKFRGEFEERIKGIIDEASSDPSVLLFIDELHLLSGAGNSEGSMDAANILKPALARGSLHLIGATTLDEYRKYIEKDKALSRRLQSIVVDEPSLKVAEKILKGVRKHYEEYHGVKINDDIITQSIYLSDRYISDRFLPDKAIDLIDEAAALAKVALDKSDNGKYKKLKVEQNDLEAKMDKAIEQENFEKAALYKTRLAQIVDDLRALEKTIDTSKTPQVSFENLATAISLKTGIPVSKVEKDEQKLLLNLEEHLKKYIIGQDEAIEKVARSVRRGRSGISDQNRPLGSFLFMGPTGVGKTELARVLAREVFGSEKSLIKIDMSEFGEKHNASRLIGAPAGYVGYEDGGKLTEAVRRHPYSVVLFDEIEKAHPEVFNLLLQILEDGTLTDGQGSKVRFNNTIIILTSNLGASEMMSRSEVGFGRIKAENKHDDNVASAMKALRKIMKPELINRLDQIVVFHPLSRKEVEVIFDTLLAELKERLYRKNLAIEITDKAKNYLIEQGFDAENGARPLRRAIEDNLESLLAEKILAGTYKKGTTAKIDLRGEHLIFTTVKA